MPGKLPTCICVLTAAIVFSCYGDTNILTNPGFESGITGWSGRSCSISAESSTVRTGSGSGKAYNRTSIWNGIKQDILSDVESGGTYQISGWVRLEDSASDTVIVSIQQTDDSGTNYYNVDNASANSNGWVELSGQFTYSPTGTATILQVYFEGPAVDVNFFVDDVIVYGPSSSPPWTPPEPNATAEIDIFTCYQELDGFGAAGAWYENLLTDNPYENDLYDLLFDDLGLDIYRLRNTYDQGATGDSYMSHTAEIITAAKLRNPDLKIMMSCWSPPTYLKSNGSLIRGTLDGGPGSYMYDELATWWADSLEAWSALGVDANYINIQNEPDYEDNWDTCRYEPTQTSSYAGYNQAFEAVYDEIYSRMGPNMPKMLAGETTGILSAENYLDNLINTSHVYGYAHHLYNIASWDDPDAYLIAMTAFQTNYGSKPLIQTEYAGSASDFTDAMNLALLMHNSLVTESVSCYLHWELFWSSPSGLVSLSSSDYTINPVYYAMKHYSKFTDPGWQRIEATTDSSALRISAYIRPDNKQMSVEIINTSSIDVNLVTSFPGLTVADGNVYRTSETENCVLVGSFDPNSPLALPAESITTLSLSVTPPDVMADAGEDITAYAFIDGYADVNMDGSGSYEVNDLPLNYDWSWSVDGNDYEANGVTPTIQLPVGEEIRRRKTVACDREHTIELIADNGTEQSQPDYCTVNVIPPIQSKLRCKPGKLSAKTRQTEIMATLKIKGIGIDDIDWDESLIFYPGAIEGEFAIDRKGLEILKERGTGTRQTVKMKVLFDKDLVEAELDLGVNTVHVVVKANSGQYYDFAGTMKLK